jgi:IclR family acetate operon transcriptional repressor
MGEESNQPVRSVLRAFALLDALATADGEASLGDLAATLQLPPPTVHRLLRTLSDLGYVMQLPSRQYTLGPGLMRLGVVATRRMSSWATPALARVSDATNETANMAVLDGDMVVYVAQALSPKHQMRMFTEVGRRVFPHSTGVGKALLAQLPDRQVLEIVRRTGMPRFTPTTLIAEDDLIADIRLSRRRGYAVDNGEQEVGVKCYAVPVEGLAVPCAISVSGPQARMLRDNVSRIVGLLRETAAVHRKMGLRASSPGTRGF